MKSPSSNDDANVPAKKGTKQASKSTIKAGWDEPPTPTKRERQRIEHIHCALRRAWERGNVVLPNAKQLAAELKITRQTVYTTIAMMQNDHNMPVELVPEQNGYRYSEEVLSSPFCKFSESEVLAVYLSHEMMSAFHEMPLKKKAQSAFRKVIEQTGDELSFDAAMVEDAFSITPSGHPAYYHPEHFEACCRAVLRREELEMVYTKHHGDGAGVPSKRRVQPLHLTFHEFAWYLLCWDPKAADYRCFMLTRIDSLTETEVKFQRPKNFNAREILRKNFGIFSSGKTEEVVLEFSPKVKRLLTERKWRKMVKREENAAGGVRLTLKAAITPDLVAWIASFLDDCRIVAPASLREDVSRRQALASAGHAQGAEW